MNLYLISQTVNDDWGTCVSAVVTALNEHDARGTHPAGHSGDWDDDIWAEKKHIKVELIGKAEPTAKRIVCASFNAG